MTIPTGTPPRDSALDWRTDASFTWPERIPWSVLGPQFAERFGNADPADPQPEHIEVIGQNGTGKTQAAGIIYQDRAEVQPDRATIIVAHKPIDTTLLKMGWPVANTWDQVVKLDRDGYTHVIFWPHTRLMGSARKNFYDYRISDLLDRLWVLATPGHPADIDLVIDDWGFAEKLPETAGRLEQFLREGRGPGFSVGALKQRPQGSTRLMSSETQWTLGFRPKDDADLERWAQLFGSRRDWMPVFRTVSREKREFVLKHAITQVSYISWMDRPLEPREPVRRRRRVGDWLGLSSR